MLCLLNRTSYQMLQDLHTRTSNEHPRRTFIQAPQMQSIFKISMQDLLGRISTGSPQDLLTRICARSCKDPWGDVAKISWKSSQGIVQDLGSDLHARTSRRISQPRNQGRNFCKILIQEPPTSIREELSYKHPKRQASSRSSLQQPLIHGIWKIFMQGHNGLYKALVKIFIREGSPRNSCCRELIRTLFWKLWEAASMSIAPLREQSDMHNKVTAGLREQYQHSHRESDPTCTKSQKRLREHILECHHAHSTRHEKWPLKIPKTCQKNVLPRF